MSSEDYRFGFNGKVKDNEIKGNANSIDFGARIYDPRFGRWLSVDPLVKKYPYSSPYDFALNSPLLLKDIDGREVGFQFSESDKKTVLDAINFLQVKSLIFKSLYSYQVQAQESYKYMYTASDENENTGGSYSSYQTNVFQKILFSNFYRSVITLKIPLFNSKLLQSEIAEEVFHGGQAIFYGRINGEKDRSFTNNSSIAQETEAKVYKAYSMTFNDERESYIQNFSSNKDVIAYFDALKSGNVDEVNKTEGAFRKQVSELAKNVQALYPISKDELQEFIDSGSKTEFFDSVTKKGKSKN